MLANTANGTSGEGYIFANLAFAQANGAWATANAAAGGGTSPGGANTQVQFNDGGAFNAVANLTFDKTTEYLKNKGIDVLAQANTANTIAQQSGDIGNSAFAQANAALTTTFTYVSANTYILTNTDNGTTFVGNNASTINVYVANTLSSNFYCQFIQNGAGTIALVANGSVNLQARVGQNSAGNLASFVIQALRANVFLVGGDTDGQTNGGSGTPGGSNTQIQFNDSSAFAGDANLTFDKTTGILKNKGIDVLLHANDAYGAANIAFTHASDAYTAANNGTAVANQGYGMANNAYTDANSAIATANSKAYVF